MCEYVKIKGKIYLYDNRLGQTALVNINCRHRVFLRFLLWQTLGVNIPLYHFNSESSDTNFGRITPEFKYTHICDYYDRTLPK